MNLQDAINLSFRNRHSVRSFDPDFQLSDEILFELIRSIDYGPSAGAIRPYTLAYTAHPDRKDELYDACLQQQMVKDCSMVFCICSIPRKSKEKYGERGNLYATQDATIAGMCLNFTASLMGLAACWIGSIDENKVREIFKLGPDVVPLSFICVGKER